MFGMANHSTGPRWLVETRHKSTFRHWETTAALASMRPQPKQESEQRRALINFETGAESRKEPKFGFKIIP
jgi:hypothetical protein